MASSSERLPESSRIERSRLRLPRSDSGRLIRSIATLTSKGTAASAPTETRAMAVACRNGRLTLSATNIPMPSPNAVRASESKPSSGTCSPVFGMDIESDIAYPYTSRFRKGNGKISPPARSRAGRFFCDLTNHAQRSLRAHPRRRKRRTLLAVEPAGASETIAAAGGETDAAGASGGASGRIDPAGAATYFDERRPRSSRAGIAAAIAEEKHRGGTREARHSGSGRTRGGMGRGARSCGDNGGVAGRPRHQRYGGIPKDFVGGGRGGRGNRRAGDNRNQANVGLPRLWLHRARRSDEASKCRRRNCGSSRGPLSGKTECGSGGIVFAERKFPLECGHVRLVGAVGPERIQSTHAGARELHLAALRAGQFRENFARALPGPSADFIRLRDHGEGRSRVGRGSGLW